MRGTEKRMAWEMRMRMALIWMRQMLELGVLLMVNRSIDRIDYLWLRFIFHPPIGTHIFVASVRG
jgi:hypothetical protein